jgi:hypothetical protein
VKASKVIRECLVPVLMSTPAEKTAPTGTGQAMTQTR